MKNFSKQRLLAKLGGAAIALTAVSLIGLLGHGFVLASAPGHLPANYESLKASDKLQILWALVSNKPVTEEKLELESMSFGDILSGLSASFAAEAFLNNGDEMAAGRDKVIHANGAVASVEFTPESASPFTGVFHSGAVGMIRLSIAAPNLDNFTPGLALKFFIDGKSSSNLVAMYSLNGQGSDLNFFRFPFGTTIADPEGIVLKLGAKAFDAAREVVRDEIGSAPSSSTVIPMNDLASVEKSGQLVPKAELRVPTQLKFVPTAKATHFFEEQGVSGARDFRATLARFPVGAGLYRVYAYDHSKLILIGKITTTSTFVASKFGDKHLYFKHPVPRARKE